MREPSRPPAVCRRQRTYRIEYCIFVCFVCLLYIQSGCLKIKATNKPDICIECHFGYILLKKASYPTPHDSEFNQGMTRFLYLGFSIIYRFHPIYNLFTIFMQNKMPLSYDYVSEK